MKIVHVEDVFHPDTGYQLNLLSKYMVAAGNDVTIVTAEMKHLPSDFMNFFGSDDIEKRDKAFYESYGVKIIRVPIKGYYSGRVILSGVFFDIIKNEHPDVVFLHGNDTLTGMRYLLKFKAMKFPLVMDSHMLDMASKNNLRMLFRFFYRKIFTPIITRNRIKVIRTQDSDYIERALDIPLSLAPWISTGSDTMLFKEDVAVRRAMREKHQIGQNAFVVTYAGKLDEGKGGLFLANALKNRFITTKDLSFVIVGNTTGEYGRHIEALFSNSENNVLRFPTQKYLNLAPFFQMSDLVVFPKQCSLTFYDVQACGVPVLFENNEINVKRAQFGNAITFTENSVDSFRNKITMISEMNSVDYKKMSNAAKELICKDYDYRKICDKYLNVIENSIADYKLNDSISV